MTTLGEILLVFLLIALNGFFVATEFAMVKLRRSRIEERVRENDTRALAAKRVLDHLDMFLAATQVGITLASLGLGWIGEPLMARLFYPIFAPIALSPDVIAAVSFIVGFLLLTSLHIVLGEQVPKILAIHYDMGVALATATPLTMYYRAFRPMIRALNKMVDFALRIFGLPKAAEASSGQTREELLGVILESMHAGSVQRSERTMIESLFDFGETTVREIMVHRSEVVALDLDTEPRELLRIIEQEGYSRLPVFQHSLDEIQGVLYVKELLPAIGQLERLSIPSHENEEQFFALLKRALRPAMFVSETQPIADLLVQFQKRRVHMGIVVSEHGGVEGIVTLEDILEELVGEIRDESDVGEMPDVIESGNRIFVDPTMSINDFNERVLQRFQPAVPALEESGDYQTVSGYVQKQAGRIPNIGDIIESGGLRFTVTRKTRHKLEQIKIEKLPPIETTANGPRHS